jgi:diguanylate cyclase (GGDEF)-like protein
LLASLLTTRRCVRSVFFALVCWLAGYGWLPHAQAAGRVTQSEISALRLKSLDDANAVTQAVLDLVNRLEPSDSPNIQLSTLILFANNLANNARSNTTLKFIAQAIELAKLTDQPVALAHLQLLRICARHYSDKERISRELVNPWLKLIATDSDRVQFVQTLLSVAGVVSDSWTPDFTLEVIDPIKRFMSDNPKLTAVEPLYLGLYTQVLLQTGDIDAALVAQKRILDIATKLNNIGGIGLARFAMGDLYVLKSDWPNARDSFAQSYRISEKLNDLSGLTWSATRLAIGYAQLGTRDDDARARSWGEIALPLQPHLEDPNGVLEVKMTLAQLALRDKDLVRAQKFYDEVSAQKEILLGRNIRLWHKVGAGLAVAKGDYRLAHEQAMLLNEVTVEQSTRGTSQKMKGLRSLLANSEAERVAQATLAQQHEAVQETERGRLRSIVVALGVALLAAITSAALYLYYRSARFRKLAEVDELTGVSARRAIVDFCKKRIRRADRQGQDFSIAIFDLDHFKQLNDRHGHAGGDLLLQRIATVVKEGLGEQYQLGRLGGDEFLVAMPGANEALASQLAQNICLLAHQIDHERNPGWHASVSVGVTTRKGKVDFATMYLRADKALYAAKAQGRDQFVHSSALYDAAFGHSQLPDRRKNPPEKTAAVVGGAAKPAREETTVSH